MARPLLLPEATRGLARYPSAGILLGSILVSLAKPHPHTNGRGSGITHILSWCCTVSNGWLIVRCEQGVIITKS